MHPDNLLYSPEHIWLKKEDDGNVRLGITYHYQAQLKNIVYLDLPEVGAQLQRSQPFASLESSKSAVDLPSPVSGTVIETNKALQGKPGVVNKDPYGEGWMLLVKPTTTGEINSLLSADKYVASVTK